jgi:hypothetical protein
MRDREQFLRKRYELRPDDVKSIAGAGLAIGGTATQAAHLGYGSRSGDYLASAAIGGGVAAGAGAVIDALHKGKRWFTLGPQSRRPLRCCGRRTLHQSSRRAKRARLCPFHSDRDSRPTCLEIRPPLLRRCKCRRRSTAWSSGAGLSPSCQGSKASHRLACF